MPCLSHYISVFNETCSFKAFSLFPVLSQKDNVASKTSPLYLRSSQSSLCLMTCVAFYVDWLYKKKHCSSLLEDDLLLLWFHHLGAGKAMMLSLSEKPHFIKHRR